MTAADEDRNASLQLLHQVELIAIMIKFHSSYMPFKDKDSSARPSAQKDNQMRLFRSNCFVKDLNRDQNSDFSHVGFITANRKLAFCHLRRSLLVFVLIACCLDWSIGFATAQSDFDPTDQNEYRQVLAPFIQSFCSDCHEGKLAEAGFRLDDIDPIITSGKDTEKWEKALEMISILNMPPEGAAQPDKEVRRKVEHWILAELRKIDRGPDEARLAMPEFGNRVDHEELFSGKHQGPAYSRPRIWRKNEKIFRGFERSQRLPLGSNPFPGTGGKGFQDYTLHKANQSTITSIQTNANNYVAEIIDGRRKYWEFKALVEEQKELTRKNLDDAVRRAFVYFLYREPSVTELERYRKFLSESIEIGGRRRGLKTMLTAVILTPEFIYRQEIGLGELLPDGRRMLSPKEISFAIAYALTDSPPDGDLQKAVQEGRLSTKKDIEREVRRMLDVDTRDYWSYPVHSNFETRIENSPNPRVLRFFREFFDYDKVFDVFKDKERNKHHKPRYLFKDADLFVLSILEKDKKVLENLLTSNEYVVHYVNEQQAQSKLDFIRSKTKSDEFKRLSKGITPVLGQYRGGDYFTSYNLERATWNYPIQQPFTLDNRAGMLTHPAWLAAHSGNFDTDPIRRGKWIRERLLADVIPEIPIGVDAKLEDNPHKTLRERLRKTEATECWRCHKKMNPLGLAFEGFDDFGRFRENIYIDQHGEITATESEFKLKRDQSKNRKYPDLKFTTVPVDTTGKLSGTGNPELDGEVKDAFELVHRLAKSERVRQSFVRHAFRYWMGRNETLNDSPTLMAVDRAYVDSDGSFKELLVALLTSDSFLMRRGLE